LIGEEGQSSVKYALSDLTEGKGNSDFVGAAEILGKRGGAENLFDA